MYPDDNTTIASFTGKILMQNLNGSFINGYKVKEGIITAQYVKKNQNNAITSKDIIIDKVTFTDYDVVIVKNYYHNPLNSVNFMSLYTGFADTGSEGNSYGMNWDYGNGGGGGSVIHLDEVIIDNSFKNNPCLKGIYDKLGGSSTFQNHLKEFDGDFSLVNLKLSLGLDPKYPNATAITYEPINSLIEIKFNPNKLNTPPLDIARTFMHEMIHAEMYRKLLTLSNKKEIPWSPEFIEGIRNDEKEIAYYYTMYRYEIPLGGSPSEPQHEYMAQLSRDLIIQTMKQFDNTQSNDVYNALAWIGLMGGGEPNELIGLPPQPTAAWSATPQAERIRKLDIYRNFIKNNPKCQ
ncbi:hypothetical protein [Flavobacterium sp. 14A]|uniref:hypothetical protein n=1 Tax=Flavobacterium sp. 14A TaxID=2735896 RepID=UPI00156F6729|nr:hypothetical protein [Flavobacterium sp. 14A]NRT13086.1 hypothetical protein [Flavobacterium sp. 14A]